MRGRGLLIATIVFAALAGLVYWSNRQKAKEDAAPPKDTTSQKLISVSEPDVTKVELKKKEGADIVLDKSGGAWRITAPEPYPADQEAAQSLVSSAVTLNSDSVVEERAADPSQFGLAPPVETVIIGTKNGSTKTVLLGDDAPTGGSVYAQVPGNPKLFTVASWTKSSLDKSLNDLRDKRLLTFNQDKLTSVDLTTKGQNVEFGKNNANEWQIVKPKPYRADGMQVDDLIRKLKDAKADFSGTEEDRKKAASEFASAAPVATAKVTDASGTQQLQVRKTKSGDYYAKSSAVEGVFKVTSDLGDGLNKTLDDFRNKKLFDFGFTDPNRIEMHDGAKSYVFTRTGEKWYSNGKELDTISVQSFLDKLRELSASKFVDTGFTTPAIDITMVSNDNKRTEKVQLAKVGDNYIAKREDEPSVYQLDAKTVQDLETAAGDVKPAVAAKKK